MAKLKPGDKVRCRIKSGEIVTAYDEYDEEKDFEIIATDSRGYFIYIPDYLNLRTTVRVTPQSLRLLGIDSRFLGCALVYITTTKVTRIVSFLDGATCIECNEFYKYAEPNQPDGTLICYSCREYPIYLSDPHDED